jgi:hypothetical protein
MKILTNLTYSHYSLFVILVLFNFTFFNGNAQQSNENTFIINQYFQMNKDASSLLENKVPANYTGQSQDNLVLNQMGSGNQIGIKGNVNDPQTVSQSGNNNDYQFINYYNSTPSNFNISQQGNANSLQIYGENSLIKNMSIVQKGSFKTLIIKNY